LINEGGHTVFGKQFEPDSGERWQLGTHIANRREQMDLRNLSSRTAVDSLGREPHDVIADLDQAWVAEPL